MYPDRPASLDNTSLYDFLSQYDKVPIGRDNQNQLQRKTLGYCLKKRTYSTYIVTHRLINPNKSPEDEEQHYYQLLKLFKPWRNETDLIAPGHTYKETFTSENNTYPDMAAYHNQLREAKQRLGSISSVPLWQTFSYDELTVNVRQHGDKEYANLLSNVRLGFISVEEYNLLNTRRISPHHTNAAATTEEIINTYYDLISAQQSPVILLPRTEQCDKVNAALLARLESEVMDLTAIDTLDTVVDKRLLPKVQKAYKKVDEDITRTAGRDKCLRVCVGPRVILKRNTDVEAGLVNGAVGVVTGFHKTMQTTVSRFAVTTLNLKTRQVLSRLNDKPVLLKC